MSGEEIGKWVGGDVRDLRNCVVVTLGMLGLVWLGVFG